jgi:hypothetical protein
MKKPSNKAIAIYLTWGIIHLGLWLSSPRTPHRNNSETGQEIILYYPNMFFYPFTKGEYDRGYYKRTFENFDLQFYDFTEFAFYMIAPILIYYVITLFQTKDEADK